MKYRHLLLALLVSLTSAPVRAQAPAPPPPKEYDVQLRYRIQAGRNDRLVQYFAFIKYLDSVGLRRDPGELDEPDNPLYDRITGTIASDKVRELLRAPAVKSLLLLPSGYQLPADLNQPVKVRLELAAGRPLEQQRILSDQVREQLFGIGYREPVLYDHRGYTRLVGTVPVGNVPDLFKDIRTRPDGWFAPLTALQELPLPLRNINAPIRIAEVTPEPEGVAPVKDLPAPPELPKGQEKLSADLRALVGKEEKPQRLNVVLLRTPATGEPPWQGPLLDAVQQLNIEGRAGQVVTVFASPAEALALAKLSTVVSIHLARSGAPLVPPATAATGGNAEVLSLSGLARLHAQGFRGQGVRVALISGDFRGWEALRGKQLPRTTRLIDLTRERDVHLFAEPYAEKEGVGHGTQCAVAVMQAAPETELVLVRVDPASLPHALSVAQSVNGEYARSEAMERRREEFELERQRITARWDDLLKERRTLQDTPASADELDPDAIKQRERVEGHKKDVAKLTADEKLFRESFERYLQLLADLNDLKRVRVVISTLYWADGQPTDGSSPLSRYLDDRAFRSTWWMQAAGDTRGQAWVGLFRDADNNGVMEFAPASAPLRPERWTPEVNFLAWQPFSGSRRTELPEKTTLRVSLQWREAHDPAFLRNSEDPYDQPLANVRVVLLRQRDPSGKLVPADEMEVVARASGTPLRLSNSADASTYEQVLEFTVESAGRYALRVEGFAPTSTRPPNAATLPDQKQTSGEFRPRLFLDAIDPASRAAGRPVFLDYGSGEGDVAMPGDAVRAVAVGAADHYNLPRNYSASGPAMNLDLLLKPNVLAYDGLELVTPGSAIHGTGVSAAFAGGLAASLLTNGAPPLCFRNALPTQRESMLLVPDWWQGYRPIPRR